MRLAIWSTTTPREHSTHQELFRHLPDLDRETPQVASSNLTQLKTRRRSNTQPAYDEIT
jgi:hypothetical protein